MDEKPEIIPLWPDGVPGAHDPADLPRLEIHRPLVPLSWPVPGVVICPGGGYAGRAPHEAGVIAKWLGGLGFWAAVVHYRVKPHGFPAPYDDACRAMRLARSLSEEEGLRPERLAIMGFSAGGHLAATVAVQPELRREPADDLASKWSARPDGLILAYPVLSFVEWGHEGSRANLLGPNPSLDQRIRFSAERQVDEHTPPTFLFHTDRDPGVPMENATRFAEACHQHGVPVELHVFPGDRHGVGLAAEDVRLGAWTELLTAWLEDFSK
jgi:acetyl esterase/lipase